MSVNSVRPIEKISLPKLVPTPRERADAEHAEARRQLAEDNEHARFMAESLFVFGRQVVDFADRYPTQYQDRTDAEGKKLYRRFMDQLCRFSRQFETLADKARAARTLPINHERLDAAVDQVRAKVVALTLGEPVTEINNY